MKKTSLYLLIAFVGSATGCTDNKPASAALIETTIVGAATHPYFIHLSDIHLDSYSSHTEYKTDTGTDLWKITYEKLDSILGSPKPPQFVIYTGDLPAHNTTRGTTTSTCTGESEGKQTSAHLVNVKTLINSIYDLFSKYGHIPFFYLPGNNDGLYCDYCSFDDKQQGTFLSQMPKDSLPAIHADASCGNPPCLLEQHLSSGYYAARLMPGLRLLSLNSIIFGSTYIERDGICQIDAGNRQISWLRGQLKSASHAGDKVYIAMHIPPGVDAYSNHQMWASLPAQNPWTNQFLGMVDSNQSTVAGILFGHTHMDEVRRLYNLDGTEITEVAISAPGISPIHKNNPGFKLVYFDPASKDLLDFETCYTTPGASTYGNASYRFSSTYGSRPGSGQSIADCLKSMQIQSIDEAMNTIYMVKSKTASSSTITGIEVKPVSNTSQ